MDDSTAAARFVWLVSNASIAAIDAVIEATASLPFERDAASVATEAVAANIGFADCFVATAESVVEDATAATTGFGPPLEVTRRRRLTYAGISCTVIEDVAVAAPSPRRFT